MKFFKNKPNLILILHVLIGLFAISQPFILVFSSLLLVGVFHIISSKNSRNQALYWCMYALASEVLFRMAGGAMFHEYIKYLCMLYLIFGLAVEVNSRKINGNFVIYIFLLLVSILFAQQDTFKSFVQEISFNLSGPVLVGIAGMYLYKRILTIDQVFDLLKVSILPIISILTYLFVYTPDVSEIDFVSSANFAASGGFGPNQLSTILGFGIFIFISLLINNQKVTNFLVLDLMIFAYLFYRELLTFSRGGLITGFIASLIILFFYIKSGSKSFLNFTKLFFFIFIIVFGLLNYTSNKTDNILEYRLTGKNTFGDDKTNILSNRIGFLSDEFNLFIDNPFFGVGVGGSKYERQKNYSNHLGSTHNEISRLFGEHGILGVFLFLFLISSALKHIYKYRKYTHYSFSVAFLILWFLTINHSAMRLAFPAIAYGLSLIIIKKNENTIHR